MLIAFVVFVYFFVHLNSSEGKEELWVFEANYRLINIFRTFFCCRRSEVKRQRTKACEVLERLIIRIFQILGDILDFWVKTRVLKQIIIKHNLNAGGCCLSDIHLLIIFWCDYDLYRTQELAGADNETVDLAFVMLKVSCEWRLR